jgi:hypothetical protein
MANNAFISSPSGMSNAQQGTRGLSAGDWVRLKRLRSNRVDTVTNSNKATASQLPYSVSMNVFKVVGTSRIQKPASGFTELKAYGSADYVLTFKATTTSPSVTNTVSKLCTCLPPPYSVKKLGICTKCNVTTHVRIM